MEICYNVTGSDRKAMVGIIAKVVGMKPVYKGAPTFAYAINNILVEKDGTMVWDDRTESETIDAIKQALSKAGFESEPTSYSIAVPYDCVAVGNLIKILEAKGELIRKALGADNVQLVMEDDRVEFHWFTRELTADEVNTYMLFITALCRTSKELKRVNATEKPIENEKYAFRCFLLRLGFIGDAYKPARKILLSRLTGSAAFKSGSKGGADDAVSE